MNSRIIFLLSENLSSFSVSIFRSLIVVIAFLNEPLILRNGISVILKSSSLRLCCFRTSCSISPSRSCENLVL